MSNYGAGTALFMESPVLAVDVYRPGGFRDRVPVGQRLYCMELEEAFSVTGKVEKQRSCMVRRKYPYFAETTRGNFPWHCLAVWNLDLYRKCMRG